MTIFEVLSEIEDIKKQMEILKYAVESALDASKNATECRIQQIEIAASKRIDDLEKTVKEWTRTN